MISENVKVWNDNIYPFSQKFKGDVISIEPGKFVEMDYWEAVSFLGKPSPIIRDGAGKPSEKSFKKLRIEGKPPTVETVAAFICHADGSLHKTEEALNEHIRSRFSDLMADKNAKEALLSKPVNKGGRPAKAAEEAS